MFIDKGFRATCPFCGLHCTDLRLTIAGGRLESFAPGCSRGETAYRAALEAWSEQLPQNPDLQTARTWLSTARQPLVILAGDSTCEVAVAAVRLAQRYSAFLVCGDDQVGSVLDLSIQSAGYLTASLDELRHLSLAVLCGFHPLESTPRLSEWIGTELLSKAIHLDPEDLLTSLRWLRLACSKNKVNIPDRYADIAAQIAASDSGFVIFGHDLVGEGQPLITELLLWLADLNREKRWYALYLPRGANGTGVVETLLRETGYPGNLRFIAEGIEYSPRLWQAERILKEGWSDLCLLVGNCESISKDNLRKLAGMQTILLSPRKPAWEPDLWLPVAQPGIDGEGQVLRLDGVPLDLQPIIPNRRPLAKDILMQIMEKSR